MYTLYATADPLGISTGAFRSGPPPVGRTVVFAAVRVFTGTEGYSRRAATVSHCTALTWPNELTLFHYVLEILHFPQICPVNLVPLTVKPEHICLQFLHDMWMSDEEETGELVNTRLQDIIRIAVLTMPRREDRRWYLYQQREY